MRVMAGRFAELRAENQALQMQVADLEVQLAVVGELQAKYTQSQLDHEDTLSRMRVMAGRFAELQAENQTLQTQAADPGLALKQNAAMEAELCHLHSEDSDLRSVLLRAYAALTTVQKDNDSLNGQLDEARKASYNWELLEVARLTSQAELERPHMYDSSAFEDGASEALQLGHGSFGVVRKKNHPQLGPVALKAVESQEIAAFHAAQGPGVMTLVGNACSLTSFLQLSIIMPIWPYSLETA